MLSGMLGPQGDEITGERRYFIMRRFIISTIHQILLSKTVPLHAMEAHGGRGGIAPTHT
jgi:hypothetical protein